MLHILAVLYAKSNYMARFACRPIPPHPEVRGFSGFPVMLSQETLTQILTAVESLVAERLSPNPGVVYATRYLMPALTTALPDLSDGFGLAEAEAVVDAALSAAKLNAPSRMSEVVSDDLRAAIAHCVWTGAQPPH